MICNFTKETLMCSVFYMRLTFQFIHKLRFLDPVLEAIFSLSAPAQRVSAWAIIGTNVFGYSVNYYHCFTVKAIRRGNVKVVIQFKETLLIYRKRFKKRLKFNLAFDLFSHRPGWRENNSSYLDLRIPLYHKETIA